MGMSFTVKAHINRIKRWRSDPVAFVREEFGAEPDAWQVDALCAYADPAKQRISLQACAGPGKSTVLAWAGWHFLYCHGRVGEHPKGAAVSITSDNLKDNLWAEFAVWRGRSKSLKDLFEWTKERLFAKDHPETWFLSARSWSKAANPEEQGRTLSGLHSKFVLALIDESGEVPLSVSKAADQALSNCEFGKILQAGNPTSHDGILYAAASTLSHLWHVIRITGDPDDPKRSPRINIDWAREQIKTHGREDAWVMAYILGQFPSASFNNLLSPDEVAAAMGRHLREDQYNFAQKRLGVDVARFGDDSTMIVPRQGLASFRPAEMRGARSNEIAARLIKAKADWGSEAEFVDDTGGFGAGVIDALHVGGYAAIPINFSSKADDSRYFNKRAEMWFRMAEWVKRGGALPNIPERAREFTTPKYTFSGGKFRLEEKEQIKTRLRFSPDYADALALTFAHEEMPSSENRGSRNQTGSAQHEWDPYAAERA